MTQYHRAVQSRVLGGEWEHYEHGGDSLSTAQRRARMAASAYGEGRVLEQRRERLNEPFTAPVEVARYVRDDSKGAGDNRLRARKVPVPA
jgi:hypothetical protein